MRSLRTTAQTVLAARVGRPRKPLTGLVAATVTAALAATTAGTLTGPAQAAPSDWVISVPSTRVYLSPNKDTVQDKVAIRFNLSQESKVTVKVRRDNKKRTLVYKEELGKLRSYTRHRWVWKGKNTKGKVVRDGRYTAIFVADQVAKDGRKKIRSTPVLVDTTVTPVETPELSLDTLYPRTTILHDAVGVTVRSVKALKAKMAAVKLRVRNDNGKLVRTLTGHVGWESSATVVFDGRDKAGEPLPGGKYTLRFLVTDRAGNVGKSPKVALNISDQPLVEKTGTLVLPPTGSWRASEILAGTAPTSRTPVLPAPNESEAYPCGTVVPSAVYSNPGAMSFRSDDTCTGSFATKGLYAYGQVALDNITEPALRGGLYSTQLSMRGRPTVPGESDTVTVTLKGVKFGFNGVLDTTGGATSPAVAEETVTTTDRSILPRPAWPREYYVEPKVGRVDTVYWAIVARGTDSFDVADVTLTYTYLAPQQ
jgi:flagellar hook assembly protein FlgD